MAQYINKDALVAEIKRLEEFYHLSKSSGGQAFIESLLSFLDTLEVKEIDLELENENNNPKITTGTKIRLKMNPDIILSIISDDCHDDEFECSNGSVLSLKQIEKYYDII